MQPQHNALGKCDDSEILDRALCSLTPSRTAVTSAASCLVMLGMLQVDLDEVSSI